MYKTNSGGCFDDHNTLKQSIFCHRFSKSSLSPGPFFQPNLYSRVVLGLPENDHRKKSTPAQVVGAQWVQHFFLKTTLRSVLAKLVNWAILCGKLYISDGGSILIREASKNIQSLNFMKYHLFSERRWQRWEAERCYRPDRQERGLSSEDTTKSRPAEVSRYYLRHINI